MPKDKILYKIPFPGKEGKEEIRIIEVRGYLHVKHLKTKSKKWITLYPVPYELVFVFRKLLENGCLKQDKK